MPHHHSIEENIAIAREAIASSESDLKRAAAHIAEATTQGATQRQIASAIGKSAAWVNRLLAWHNSGYQDETPFGPESKAKREREQEREHVQAPEQGGSKSTVDELLSDLDLGDGEPNGDAYSPDEPEQPEDDLAARRRKKAKASGKTEERSFDERERERLVKTLGMLGSDHQGERDSAAQAVEKQRAALGMTWDELIAMPAALRRAA